MTRRLRLAALLGAAVLALAACSGGAATAAPATTVPATEAPATAAPVSAPPSAPSPAATEAPSEPASAAPEACTVVDGGEGTAAEIRGFSFPTDLSVAAGGAIAWTNGDSAPHTVTFDDGSCGTQMGPGATVAVRYDVPGTFAFHCAIHPQMTGTLVVEG